MDHIFHFQIICLFAGIYRESVLEMDKRKVDEHETDCKS